LTVTLRPTGRHGGDGIRRTGVRDPYP
jgi:hypothetical protein